MGGAFGSTRTLKAGGRSAVSTKDALEGSAKLLLSVTIVGRMPGEGEGETRELPTEVTSLGSGAGPASPPSLRVGIGFACLLNRSGRLPLMEPC